MVIFVLRHADRSATMADALSPAGVKRAERLAHMLAECGVSAGFCSDAERTRATLAPLKQARGNALTIAEVSTEGAGGLAAHVQAVVAAVAALPADAVAVVVGHSNTVDRIIDGLGGGAIAPIAETEFDRLFVLFRPATGNKTLLQMRY